MISLAGGGYVFSVSPTGWELAYAAPSQIFSYREVVEPQTHLSYPRILSDGTSRTVEQHEALERLMSLDVEGRNLQGKAGKFGGIVLLASHLGLEDDRVLG
jgi:hypothetical protein